MIRAIRPSAMAQDDATLITGWNIAPNVAYTVSVSVSASAVVVLLADADNSGLIGSGLALVGTDQPVTITPMTGQTIGMVDADLGWHLRVTTSGTEGDRTIRIGPAVDLPDEIHPIYADDGMALARATAAINAGACYVDDVAVTCPLGLGAGIGYVLSAPVDGSAVVGQVESITWSGSPDGTSEAVVIRRHTAIAPEAYTQPPAPPVLADDTAETDASTATSGNVLDNDDDGLTVTAVNGLSTNVGVTVAGSNGGDFVLAADGSWAFDPSGDFAALGGSDTATTSVTYHASNGRAEAGATLTVTVSSADVQPWTPAEITTALWLDASDGSTITLNGSTVSEWRDKSGNNRHLVQTSSANQPTLTPSNSILFSGAHWMRSDTARLPLSTLVMCYVCKESTPYTANGGFLSVRGSSYDYYSTDGITFSSHNKTTGRAVFGGSSLLSFLLSDATQPVDAAMPLAIYSAEKSTTTGSLYVNGAPVASDTSFTAFSSVSAGGFAIGARYLLPGLDTTNYLLKGEVMEVVYAASADRQKIEGYLAHRWDALLNVTTFRDALPSNHPYKTTAP